jgi:methyltransferase
MDSVRLLFLAGFLLLVGQRLWELRVSARHVEALKSRGAVELGRGHYPFMVAVQVAWLAAWGLEVLWLGTRPWKGSPLCAVIFAAAAALRSWSRRSLGERWTTRVLVLPGEPRIRRGPYRWLRHPNYLAVALEMLSGPLVFGAWRSALGGTALYLSVLLVRQAVEDRGLDAAEKASARR